LFYLILPRAPTKTIIKEAKFYTLLQGRSISHMLEFCHVDEKKKVQMKVLVVGGAGYIGSHVAREFLDQGHEVTVFDNLSLGSRDNLFDEAAFFLGDICQVDDLKKVFSESSFDGVIHLAALKAVGDSMTEVPRYSNNNIIGTLNLLNAMVEAGVNKWVFSSSAAIFGEPQYLPIDEKHPKAPESYYGFTKLAIENFMPWYDRLKGIRFASLRYFNAAGYDTRGRIQGLEATTSNLLPVLMEVAVGQREKISIFGSDYETRDGSCIRDYIHVSDLAVAHVLSLQSLEKNDRSLYYNLGTENGSSVFEMLELARKITGKEIPSETVARRAGDPSNLIASSKLIQSELKWSPKFSDLETIIESTWNVYKNKDL
jgi:UDP-glucose 4-epimerase